MKIRRHISIGIIFTILLIGSIVFVLVFIGQKKPTQKTEIPKPTSLQVATKPEQEEETKQVTEWNLKLVNDEYGIEEDYEIPLSKIDEQREFDTRALPALKQMIEACRTDGNKAIWAQSTYRSYRTQQTLFQNKVNYYQKQGYDEQQALQMAKKLVNKPGHSEHNLGLAVDFNQVNNQFEHTKEFSWLCEHAAEYGFIMRYPKEKEEITKVSYEPWHWRYVGIEHAKKMNENNWCLEEYIEHLTIQDNAI